MAGLFLISRHQPGLFACAGLSTFVSEFLVPWSARS